MLPSTCAAMHAVTAQNADQRKWAERGRAAEEFSQRSPGYSKIANKLLGKWKWFCTSQTHMQRCHIPLSVLAKHRKLENQVGKEQKLVSSSCSCTRINNNKKVNHCFFCLKSRRTTKAHWRLTYVTSRWFSSCVLILDTEKGSLRSCRTQAVQSHTAAAKPLFSALRAIRVAVPPHFKRHGTALCNNRYL